MEIKTKKIKSHALVKNWFKLILQKTKFRDKHLLENRVIPSNTIYFCLLFGIFIFVNKWGKPKLLGIS